jgi:hypothetical protein
VAHGRGLRPRRRRDPPAGDGLTGRLAVALSRAAAIAFIGVLVLGSIAPPVSAGTVLPVAGAMPVDTVVPVLAVLLRDDDGKRAVAVTPAEVAAWVGEANAVWSAAGMRLAFDPATDVETIADSVLNGIGDATDRGWAAESAAANAFAAAHPGRLTILFRYGPSADPSPTTTSYAAATADFIAMPRFDPRVCGAQDLTLLAHEVGHWLGVPNTYPRSYRNAGDADAWIRSHLGSPGSFDGDGFDDTAPDPFIADPAHQCGASPTLDINGSLFTLPRTNIMSSYPARHDLSPSQIARARWVLALRVTDGLATPTNAGVPDATPIAPLDVPKKAEATCEKVAPDPAAVSRWGAAKQLRCVAAPKGSVSVALPALAAPGPYQLTLYGGTVPDGATYRVLLDGVPVAEAVDAWSPVTLPTGPLALGSHDLASGAHTLTFEVTGAAVGSRGHVIVLDTVRVLPLTLPLGLSAATAPVRGGRFSILATTRPGARCTLTVPKAIAPSSGRGLPARIAPDSGNVRWSWVVPKKAAAREYTATATCTLDPASGRATLRFAVRP